MVIKRNECFFNIIIGTMEINSVLWKGNVKMTFCCPLCVLHVWLCFCDFADVTKLLIQRPPDFKFLSGQWVRLSCPSLGDNVFHPFTISSAPHSAHLSVHVRAVGPWTRRLRQSIKQALNRRQPLPRVRYFIDYILMMECFKCYLMTQEQKSLTYKTFASSTNCETWLWLRWFNNGLTCPKMDQ